MEPRVTSVVARKFDDAFRRRAVEMVVEDGRSVAQVAQELGVSQYSIYEWKRKFFPMSRGEGESEKISAEPASAEEVAALRRLVREQANKIEYLTQQREVLKKSLGIVCESPNNATGPSKR
jgi:transposase